MDFKGGETAALARVKAYLWDLDLLKEYKETRTCMKGMRVLQGHAVRCGVMDGTGGGGIRTLITNITTRLPHPTLSGNGMLGPNYSSKFSPWLATGSLSPRYVYQEIRRYERERVENDSTYWLIFEIIWCVMMRVCA